MHRLILFTLLLGLSLPLAAQQPNDDCANAIPLGDVSNFCSASGAFTNTRATQSLTNYPTCIPNNQQNQDVWFSFVAQATDLSISVVGNVTNFNGGTLLTPQLALYGGSCGALQELGCKSDNATTNRVNAIFSGLTVGATYYISVGARNGREGTFQLCVRNFNQVPDPSGDCVTGVILCDKSAFSVPFLSGEGRIPNEIGDVSCNVGGCNVEEASSAWYKWTCDQPGTLTFRITPLDPTDDLDFVLYELPGGIDDCNNKRDIRCMASGENVGAPFSEWFPCTGATGLSENDPDDSEACGCQTGNNNFAKAIQMEAGKSYALVILNFSRSGSGFAIEFGGTGTFVGPQADFTTSTPEVCVGDMLTFTDNSSFIGTITDYRWSFGPDAEPATATGIGPHQVRYTRPGTKSILLEIETDRGCIVSEVKQINAVCCPDHFAAEAVVSDLLCAADSSGAIDLNVVSDFAPIQYTWSNNANTEDIGDLPGGTYTVSVVDASTCTGSFSYTVNSPPPFAFDTLVVMPTCNGGTDGAVTLQVSGGTGPYEYNWQNAGFGPNNSLTNISQGDYGVIVRDANGCTSAQLLPVRELQLALDLQPNAIQMPSCFGFSNGSISLTIGNGRGPYQYDFGQGFQNSNVLTGIPAGIYTVQALDADLCEGFFQIVVGQPEALELDFETVDISCFGLRDGMIEAFVSGGTGGYTYTWSSGQSTSLITDLPAGTYSITINDDNACTLTGDTALVQPDELFAAIGSVIDNICFGESAGSITASGSGGWEPFTFSVNGNDFQADSTFTGLPAGDFTIIVRDARGCVDTTFATIAQPEELVVDAGPDVRLELGYDTTLQALSNYAPVTFGWAPDTLRCLTPDCSRVLVNPVTSTTYTVTVINADGCIATDLVTVQVVKDRPLFIPNAFSPNFDDRNDGFTLFAGPAVDLIRRLQIFDRWGNLVYQTEHFVPNAPSLGWDGLFNGKPVNPGVFVYVFDVSFIDGEILQYKGDVTVIR